MKRFYIFSAVVAVALVALSLDVLPVRCAGCGQLLFRTDACSALCGGRSDYADACLAEAVPEGQAERGIAERAPATDIQTEATTEHAS
jgi:hypothetical protein